MTTPRSRSGVAVLAATAVLLILVLAGCSSGDDAVPPDPRGTDLAFASDMVPHHEGAIEMARIARERGQSTFVKDLARDILRSQRAEVRTLRAASARLRAEGVEPASLGLSEDESHMHMDATPLRTAEPFDRAFVDMMVPHHEGAIRMARIELARGSDPELKRLARAIIAAQQREIAAMDDFREAEYGAPVPRDDPHAGHGG